MSGSLSAQAKVTLITSLADQTDLASKRFGIGSLQFALREGHFETKPRVGDKRNNEPSLDDALIPGTRIAEPKQDEMLKSFIDKACKTELTNEEIVKGFTSLSIAASHGNEKAIQAMGTILKSVANNVSLEQPTLAEDLFKITRDTILVNPSHSQALMQVHDDAAVDLDNRQKPNGDHLTSSDPASRIATLTREQLGSKLTEKILSLSPSEGAKVLNTLSSGCASSLYIPQEQRIRLVTRIGELVNDHSVVGDQSVAALTGKAIASFIQHSFFDPKEGALACSMLSNAIQTDPKVASLLTSENYNILDRMNSEGWLEGKNALELFRTVRNLAMNSRIVPAERIAGFKALTAIAQASPELEKEAVKTIHRFVGEYVKNPGNFSAGDIGAIMDTMAASLPDAAKRMTTLLTKVIADPALFGKIYKDLANPVDRLDNVRKAAYQCYQDNPDAAIAALKTINTPTSELLLRAAQQGNNPFRYTKEFWKTYFTQAPVTDGKKVLFMMNPHDDRNFGFANHIDEKNLLQKMKEGLTIILAEPREISGSSGKAMTNILKNHLGKTTPGGVIFSIGGHGREGSIAFSRSTDSTDGVLDGLKRPKDDEYSKRHKSDHEYISAIIDAAREMKAPVAFFMNACHAGMVNGIAENIADMSGFTVYATDKAFYSVRIDLSKDKDKVINDIFVMVDDTPDASGNIKQKEIPCFAIHPDSERYQ